MKKIGGRISIVLIIMLLMLGAKHDEKSNLIKYFNLSGAELLKIEIEGSSKIKTSDSLEKVALKLYNSSEIKGIYTIEKGLDFTEIKARNGKTSSRILCKKLKDENLIYVSFVQSQYYGDKNTINSIRRTISKAFFTYKAKPSFCSLIQGRYNGKLEKIERENIALKLLLSQGVLGIDGISDERITSFSGYAPDIEGYVNCIGKKINLNIALRYSSTNGCTYIWIGSPLILGEY